MLFNSYIFIFGFLPITLIGFFLLAKAGRRVAAAWLAVMSFVFYGWWSPRYIPLLGASIAFNYLMARSIGRASSDRRRKTLLTLGICGDLLLLVYYKYADFLITSLSALTGHDFGHAVVTLPLGISFFTFTQIAFLVDVSRRLVSEYDPVHYGLFVTYYPHLIAGPVLHHKEMMPQFARRETYRPDAAKLASGLTIFVFGLFKKVVIADTCGPWAAEIFDTALPSELTFLVSWAGAAAYALQIYFDFSGYSDMAIGLSRLAGIELPINFDSPYRADSVIDFWRRWHMTLSRFLRDYLYIPLGGNRLGVVRRHANLMVTMLLGGLWHGAGWTFVIWGGLHGSYLIINHVWRSIRPAPASARTPAVTRLISRGLTLIAVTVAWVFFRAPSLARAGALLRGMAGANGMVLPGGWQSKLPGAAFFQRMGVRFEDAARVDKTRILLLVVLFLFVSIMPNSQEVMERRWRPNLRWFLLVAAMATIALGNMGSRVSEFLYYRF